jgi:hypothetical protein
VPRLRSGRVILSKETVRRFGIERCQSRIEAETGPAVGTEDRVCPGHIDVDVRVVLRWGHADALEFPDPDADFRDAAVVPELRDGCCRTSTRPVVIGERSGQSAPARDPINFGERESSLLVVARTAPASEDGIQLGGVKRPCVLTVRITRESTETSGAVEEPGRR